MTYVSRDPFARQELHKANADMSLLKTGCSWCGQFNKRGGLFVYWIERDDRPAAKQFLNGRFCSVGCKDSYLAP